MKTEQSQVKVSVIIPVFNGEKYLEACLQSLLDQSIGDWEAICINDGSTDMSVQIIKRFVQKDSRYKLICQDNCGVTKARKVGVRESKGEYIIFCDSDDLLPDNSLEILLDAVLSDRIDAIAGDFRFVEENFSLKIFEKKYLQNNVSVLKPEDKFSGFCSFWYGLWSHIYRRSLFFDGEQMADIWPSEKIELGEDVLTNLALLFRAEKVAKIEEVVYYYRYNSMSVSHTAPWPKRKFYDGVRYLEELNRFILLADNTLEQAYISYLLLERLFSEPVTGRNFKKKYWTFFYYYLRWFVFAPTTQLWLFRRHRCAWNGAIFGIRYFFLSLFEKTK